MQQSVEDEFVLIMRYLELSSCDQDGQRQVCWVPPDVLRVEEFNTARCEVGEIGRTVTGAAMLVLALIAAAWIRRWWAAWQAEQAWSRQSNPWSWAMRSKTFNL